MGMEGVHVEVTVSGDDKRMVYRMHNGYFEGC